MKLAYRLGCLMLKLTWKDWTGVVGVALAVAVVAFFTLLQVQHWRQDEATFHAVVQLLNYNVAQGKLVTVAAPTSPLSAPEPPKDKP